MSNKHSKGDIIVVMDDDDWYPKTRVSHAVSALTTSPCEIAGCSPKLLYDYDLDMLLHFKQFCPNHSTNDCFAYKRSYLKCNSYDPMKDMAEEASFTKNFTNPLVQLDPVHSIISSSHSMNTFSKKEICIKSCLLLNPLNPSEGNMYPPGFLPKEKVTDYMDTKTYETYSNIFVQNIKDEFDISYFCGGTSVEWDPTSLSLGGSEQAIVNISNEWTKLGKKVAVYSMVTLEGEFEGVTYLSWNKFPFHKRHSIVILWRMSGVNCGLPFKIRTEKLWVDFHDNNFVFRHEYTPFVHKIDKLFFKSQFHLDEYQKKFGETNKGVIVPNGIRIENFLDTGGVAREPYRFCYCSCYSRGLLPLLMHVWPIIRNNEPRAELHVYYGIDSINDLNLKKHITFFMGQPGVMDHGRRPVDEIAREKQRSTFHLYVTDCPGEIDCISIRESLVSGCIPLLSNKGVFKDREGLHFDLDKGYQHIAEGILKIMSKPDFLEMTRQQFKRSKTVCSWKKVASEWLEKSL
jgi:hypothetical protein